MAIESAKNVLNHVLKETFFLQSVMKYNLSPFIFSFMQITKYLSSHEFDPYLQRMEKRLKTCSLAMFYSNIILYHFLLQISSFFLWANPNV